MRYLSRVALGAVLLFLGGCASQVNMLPTLSEKTVLQPQQGVVVAKVINASSYPLPFNQLTINPKNLNESSEVKSPRLTALANNYRGSTVFAAPVNAGDYALSSIRAFHSHGDFWYSRFVTTDAKFGTFRVNPGQVTDLGTIIYYPKSQGDKYINMLLRQPSEAAGSTLHESFPFYDFTLDSVHGWMEDEYEQERNSNYVSAARNPVTYNEQYAGPDGSLYFVGKLGIIIKRSPQGEWSMDAVDTNIDLYTIVANQRGDLVVAGDEGKVFIKRVNGDWQDVSIAHQLRVHQATFAGDNTIDLITSENHLLKVWRSTDLANVDWQHLVTFRSDRGWLDPNGVLTYDTNPKPKNGSQQAVSPRNISSVDLKWIEDRNEIFVRTIARYSEPMFENGKLESFVVDTSDWQILGEGNEQQYSTVVNAGATQLAIKEAGFWSWDGKPDYLKLNKNNGQWEEISTSISGCPPGTKIVGDSCRAKGSKGRYQQKVDRFSFASTPWFKNNDEVLAIALFREKSAESGETENKARLIHSVDGGKVWTKSEDPLPSEFCGTLIPDVKDRLLLTCKGSSMDFYESLDEGASWKHVREHENF
ncbi:hypothetical protein GNX18_10145 [Microbulbifer sp. SH-1]|uniref:hypothetical protein n=1 Tax=Microbulbifer sp. SH-1 TaxID=2681547 RepID=UPI00140BFA11|nr:hypothetical protein [Microbulbifer sp. SH-1]QIL90076.1 hypothetical protein GNX18_10145 [Microbulbifer sp. SH-1]